MASRFDNFNFICESGVMASEMKDDAAQSGRKSTGGLKLPTGAIPSDAAAKIAQPHFVRSLAMRFAEAAIFLVAVIGAIALGLGITAYFREHRYVFAFVVAYAGFRFSDLLVREDSEDLSPRAELIRRISVQLPLLVMFAAAPFERTYVYGGKAPAWLAALGLLLELLGMWLALGARIQLGFFTSGKSAENSVPGQARLLPLHPPSDLRGNLPGVSVMAAGLRRAGDCDADAHSRRDLLLSANEGRGRSDAGAFRRGVRSLYA